ncbi:TonB-dependent receptor family protein [Frateuria aurantia]
MRWIMQFDYGQSRRTWTMVAFAALSVGDISLARAQTVDGRPQAAAVAARPQAKALPTVHATAMRMDIPAIDIPASISEIKVNPADSGKPGVNLSETMVGIPGVLDRDRQNYAQDAQLSIRGFGARSAFGVRGVRIYTDGIPGTLPDGQGQISQINLATAESIEVLRGPFSSLYGNSSGGVVQVTTADGGDTPVSTIGVYGGSYGSMTNQADTRGKMGDVSYNIGITHFQTDGYRPHSRAERDSLNAKFGVDVGDSGHLSLVINSMQLPHADDPQGLTWALYKQNPRQVASASQQYNTRKDAHQTQAGIVYDQSLGDHDQIRLMVYGGQRNINQYQSIPKATESKASYVGGGVIQTDTSYGGLDLRWSHQDELLGRPYELVVGATYDLQDQGRQAFQNFVGSTLGVRGALRRNEDDDVYDLDQYLQWYWHFTERWSLMLGARHDEVRFDETDHYLVDGNNSGSANYGATTPVAGVQFRVLDNLRLYASYGKGFETPTYTELGYRSDGLPGLAFNLKPAISQNYELGSKWQATRRIEVDAAIFRSNTSNELGVYSSSNGRTTYQNLRHTRRQGYELSFTGDLGHDMRLVAGYTHLQATFESYGSGSSQTIVPGHHLPGVPSSYGSLRFEHGAAFGWREGIEFSGAGSTPANDANTAFAPGYMLVGIDGGYVFDLHPSVLRLSARIDNLADRRYVGSVIVNDSNQRYFEPGPGRAVMLGAELQF